jgi:5-methylthioadenosine/S-adenosylhomocysteine deaminase
MSDLIVNFAHVLTLDDDFRIIPNGGVVIEKDRIAYVGESQFIEKNFDSNRYIDARGGILLPGLINAHTHLTQTIFRGLLDGRTLYNWLEPIYWLRSELTPQEAYVSSMLACIESIRTGTTSLVSHHSAKHDRVGVEALAESGLRGIVARFICNYGESKYAYVEDVDTSIENTCKFVERYDLRANGRVRCAFGPIGFPYAFPDTWKEICERAKEMNTTVHSHISENQKVVNEFRLKGTSDVTELSKLGVLTPYTSLAHGIFLDRRDMSQLANSGTSIVHCPSSNSKLGLGVAPVPLMLRTGVNVALGTDGAPSNNSQNMFHEMNIAALIHSAKNKNPLSIKSCDVLRMATSNGAKSMRMQSDLGSISKGKKADMILLEWQPQLFPKKTINTNLVYSASGYEVKTVVVDGELVMENHVIKRFDESVILKDADRILDSLLSRTPKGLFGE